MTREDAIKEIPLSVFTAYELNYEQYANDACEQFEKLVNKLYDDFEETLKESEFHLQLALAQLSEYKSRTCEFPKHKGSLIITHNEHTTNYETVEKMIQDDYYSDGWISDDDKQLCIDSNSVWTIHWYPKTPIGFYCVHASTFELALEYANKRNEDD